MSIEAYRRTATQAETPRDREYRAFGQATAQLMDAQRAGRAAIAERAAALGFNRRLWTLLASDCAHPENTLPQALRAQIISIAMFVDRHSSAVMRDGAEIDPLVDINRAVMEGLAARAG
ncbi:MAG: flagellar biosynthesis regulator FlaF [Caulobacterales bacterium]|jgi:flagellar protein FlaF